MQIAVIGVGVMGSAIAGRLLDVFRRSTEEQVPPGVMADRLAQHLIASARRRQAA